MTREQRAARVRRRLQEALAAVPDADAAAAEALWAELEAQFGRLADTYAGTRAPGEAGVAEGTGSAAWVALFENDAALARDVVEDPDVIGRLVGVFNAAAWSERAARVDRKRARHLRDHSGSTRDGTITPPTKAVPLAEQPDRRAPDPARLAMARDEFAHEAILIAELTGRLRDVARDGSDSDRAIAREYGRWLRREHEAGVPLAAMAPVWRALARAVGCEHRTARRRLRALMGRLPVWLGALAPFASAAAGRG